MSRNRSSRPRRRAPAEGGTTPPRPSGFRLPRWMIGVIWQCQRCGALADPLYGTGQRSYCPSCQAVGTVMGEDWKIPAPELYHAWCRKQQAAAAPSVGHTETIRRFAQSPPTPGDPTMKRKKSHTGAFYCRGCYIEFDLVAEEALRCDRCGGPLAKGTVDEALDDLEADGDDEE